MGFGVNQETGTLMAVMETFEKCSLKNDGICDQEKCILIRIYKEVTNGQ